MKGNKWLMAGGLSVLMLALCAGIVAIFFFTAQRVATSGLRFRFFEVANVQAEADEEQTLEVSLPAVLQVQNGAGDVTISAGTGSTIVVRAHKTAYGASQADAEAALRDIQVVVEQAGSTVSVRVEQPAEVDIVHIGPGTGVVDLTIEVPAQTNVNARTEFGKVKGVGLHGDVVLASQAGEVSASELEGGDLSLTSSFGAVTLENSSGNNVTATSQAGAVSLVRVEADGAVTLNTEFGAVDFEHGRAASLSATTSAGRISLRELSVSGALTAESELGEVRLEAVTADSYDLRSNNGNISVDGARGPVRAQTEFGGVDVTNGEDVTLALDSNNGSITFQGTLGGGPHHLKTEFGSVRLVLPATTAVDLDLKTQFGRIRSDLPVTISGAPDEEHWVGQANGGGARLTAETNNGDITIETIK